MALRQPPWSHDPVLGISLLVERLRAAGVMVEAAVPATGGVAALAGLATLEDGSQVFAKTLASADADVFEIEAEGLRALAEIGGARTPEVRARASPIGSSGRTRRSRPCTTAGSAGCSC